MRAVLALLIGLMAGPLAVRAEDAPAPGAPPSAAEPATPAPAPAVAPAPETAAPPATATAPDKGMTLVETPSLAAEVAAGTLPPIAERLPKHPRVIDLQAMGRETGRQGGTWRMLMGDQRDLRMMTVYAYTRLVVFDDKLNIVPDILQSIDVDQDKVFTLHLRKGHRWSDGKPFTAEDFRYYWDDVANNPRLSPSGPNLALLAAGKPPRFEVLDPLTVRYSWDDPNPGFLPAIAASQPLYIYMPSHYLKKYHTKYADPKALDEAVKDSHVMDWGALHERKSRMYRPENPKLPTLDPWVNRTAPPAVQFSFERNPYFHRVDGAGHQLPYIDAVTLSLGTTNLVPAKTASGESDLQARYLSFEDYTFLKAAEKLHDYQARLWESGSGAYASLYPNLNCKDKVWRDALRDVRFRRALSLGINRHDINQVVFFGLARESADTVLPQSPLFRPELAAAYTAYDPKTANRLLDEMGLDKRNLDGTRLLPDGRPIEITIETAGEDQTFNDILELVDSDWHKLGIRAFTHPSHLDIFRKRIINGETTMSIARGMDNGAPTAQFEPDALAPLKDSQYQWPRWGLNFQSSGHEGEAVDMPEAQKLLDLYRDWRHSTTIDEQRQAWASMLDINADQVFSIGIVNGTRQPVVVSNQMHNVPDQALFGFEPGAFFGIYMPDTFWFSEPPKS